MPARMLASLFFVYRISDLARIDRIESGDSDIAAFSVFGALFFGSVTKLELLFDRREVPQRLVVLEIHQVISVDNTVLETLNALLAELRAHGGNLVLCGLNTHPDAQIRRSSFGDSLGEGNILTDLDSALVRACSLRDGSAI